MSKTDIHDDSGPRLQHKITRMQEERTTKGQKTEGRDAYPKGGKAGAGVFQTVPGARGSGIRQYPTLQVHHQQGQNEPSQDTLTQDEFEQHILRTQWGQQS